MSTYDLVKKSVTFPEYLRRCQKGVLGFLERRMLRFFYYLNKFCDCIIFKKVYKGILGKPMRVTSHIAGGIVNRTLGVSNPINPQIYTKKKEL